MQNLWLKDESRNPTASFKDRASAIVVARAQEIKAEIVVTASTGNAGAALAGMSAAVGQKAIIFAPKSAPQAKVAQLLVFGAKVILVDGTYDDAFDLTVKAANEFGWYCRNTGYNPFTAEGKKTAALEIWEWWEGTHEKWHEEVGMDVDHAPLTVFVSVGDGNIISGIHKGFKDLYQLGWLPRMPRIIGVQAEGSAAISNAFHAGHTRRSPRSLPTPLRIASPSTCRGMASEPSARRRKRAGRTLMYQMRKSSKPLRSWARRASSRNRPGATAYAGLVKAAGSGVVGKRGSDPGVEYWERTQGCPRRDAGGSACSDY